MTTSNDVLAAVFKRHCGAEWVNFAEVADDTGARARRRADAVCMNIWPSKGYVIHGFEIKVSRADFIKEMKDITKATAVEKYCDFWWLAVPVGLVSVDEIPASWGLMELHKNGLKIKKQAPKKDNPKDISRGFMASLLRRSRQADDTYIQTQIAAGEEARRAELQREIERQTSHRDRQVKAQAEWITTFEQKLGMPFKGYEPPENMAERLRLAESLQFGHLSRLVNACSLASKEVTELKKVMEECDATGN